MNTEEGGVKFKERRLHSIKCKMCGSDDVWRVQSQKQNFLFRIWHRGLKPFQCRACKYGFYRHARRRTDSSGSANEKYPVTNARWMVVGTAITFVALVSVLIGWQWQQALHVQAASNIAFASSNAPPFITRPQAPFVQTHVETMTNEDLVELKKAGIDDTVIIEKMGSVHAAYKLATPDLVTLKQAGVSDRVLLAMVEAMKSR